MPVDRDAWWGTGSVVLAVGVLAHWPLLRLQGTFWDDWFLVRSPELRMFTSTGRVEFAAFHRLLLWHDDPVLLARALQFGTWLVASLIFLACLRRITFMPTGVAVTAACAFAALPTYSARITQIMLPSTVAFTVLLVFWWLLLGTAPGHLGARRGAVLGPLALVSYSLQSVLVFVVVPLGLWVWMHGGPRAVWNAVRSRAALATLLASPVVYYALRLALLPPSGASEGYNAPSVVSAAVATVLFIADVPALAFDAFAGGLTSSLVATLVVAAIVGVALRSKLVDGLTDARQVSRVATLGIACAVAGLVPYLAVGKPPVHVDWGSRHQTLLTIGLAILFAFALHRVLGSRPRALHLAVAVGLGSMIVGAWGTYAEFAVDAARQTAFQQALEADATFRSARLIVVELDHELVAADDRRPRYYEMSHLARDAIGVARRDLLVLIGDAGSAPSTYRSHVGKAVPFPGEYVGLDTVNLGRPVSCVAVTITTGAWAPPAPIELPVVLTRGIATVPEFALRDVRSGCATSEVRSWSQAVSG